MIYYLRKWMTLLCLIGFSTINSFATTKPVNPETVPLDSLISWVAENVNYITDTEETKDSYPYAYIALRRSKEIKDYGKMADIHQYIASWHYFHIKSEMVDSILYHDQQALKYYELTGNDKKAAKTLKNVASSHLNRNEYLLAEACLFKAIAIFEKMNDEAGKASIYSTLSSTYIEMETYQDAIKYGEQAIVIREKLGEPAELGIALFSIVEAYEKTGLLDKALETANRSITVIESMGADKDPGALVRALSARALTYKSSGQLELALKDYIEVWNLGKSMVEIEEQADFMKDGIGEILFLQKKYKEAIPYYEDLFDHLGKRNNAGALWGKQLELAQCYEYTGDTEKALFYYNKSWTEKDSMLNSKIASLQSELQIKYETDKKDATITNQNELINQQTKIQWLSSGMLALLGLLLGGVLWGYRKNQHKNQKLETLNSNLAKKNNQNELLLKEIHHRVKNNLELVKSLLSLQSAQIEDKVAQDAIQESQNRVQSMGIIHQKLYQGENLAAVEMKDYFLNLGEGILDAFAVEDRIKIDCVMEELELDVDTAVPIGLIVNELLTNAIKYAFPNKQAGNIKIHMTQNHSQLKLRVVDDGIGKTKKDKPQGTGFGTQLISLLTMQLDGIMEEKVEDGTIVSFTFKKAA